MENKDEKSIFSTFIPLLLSCQQDQMREISATDADIVARSMKFITLSQSIGKFKKMGLKLPKIKKAFFDELDIIYDIPEKISYAFLDGDLYQSIKTSLNLVSSKMSQGGVIIVHDYNNPELPGSARAVDEWLKSHQAKITSFRVAETLAIIYCA